jgi:GT2 family glycosyltransferase
MSPRIAIIIVAWNNYKSTQECVESILNQRFVEVQIFLVDNGSKIEPLDDLVHDFPMIKYIYSSSNLGFAAGTNLGLREALATDLDYFLIINNDTRADELMLQELLAALEDQEVGLTAPIIYFDDAPDKIWSSGGTMNDLMLMPLDSHNTKYAIYCPTKRTFVSGCCYLLKREMLEQVGLFDERFFLYFEDLDFCKRINEAKWQMMVIPTAKLWHKISQSSGGQYSEVERYHYGVSSGLYFRKYMSIANAIPIILFRLGNAIKMTMMLMLRGEIVAMKSYLKGLYKGWIG